MFHLSSFFLIFLTFSIKGTFTLVAKFRFNGSVMQFGIIEEHIKTEPLQRLRLYFGTTF